MWVAGRHGGAGEGDGHTGEGSGGSVWDGVRDDGATILVAANRSRLMSLVAANILGQNSAAIAATQAEYAEMWAQDAAVMYSYEGASAAASALPPFTPPVQGTGPAGPAAAAAATQAAGAGAVADAQATLAQLPRGS